MLWRVLLILVFFRPFLSEHTYLGTGMSFVFLLMFFSVLYLILSPGPIVPRTPFNWPVLLFLLALLLSTAFGISRRWSSYELYWFIPNILIFYVLTKADQKQHQQIILAMIAAASIISIYGILQYFFGFRYALQYLARVGSRPHLEELLKQKRVLATFVSPNILASYLMMMLFVGIGLLINSLQRKGLSFWLAGSIALMIIVLLLTRALGAILISILSLFLFLFLIAYYLMDKFKDKKITEWAILIIIAGLIIFVSTSIPFLKQRLVQFFNFSNPQNSIVQRLYYWKTSIDVIRDYPWTGIGWRNLPGLYESYKPAQANISHFSHNVFLQIMAETGILGLLGFLGIVLTFLRNGLRSLKEGELQQKLLHTGIFCAGCAFLLHNLIDLSFYYNQAAFHWWIILGLLSKPKNSDS